MSPVFKDVSDLHRLAVETDQPEMLKKVLDTLVWEAELEYQKHVSGERISPHYPLTAPLAPSLREGASGAIDLSPFGAERFVDMGDPEPPEYLVRNIVEVATPTYMYGGRGSLKSIKALAVGIGISSHEVQQVLGYPVEDHGPVVIFDSELNKNVFNRRATELCQGMGIDKPKDLYYLNVVGRPPTSSFPTLHKLIEVVGAVAVVIDSFGFATRGDPLSYMDTRDNTANYIDPIIASGVAAIIVEHKPHQGNHIFGSVLKEYHGRYIFRTEDLDGDDRVKGERNTRLINEKASWAEEGQKTTLVTKFSPGKIEITNVEVPDAEVSEVYVNAEVKVRRALEKGDKTKDPLVQATGLSETYLRNTILPRMNKAKQIFVRENRRPYTYTLTAPSATSPGDRADGAVAESGSTPLPEDPLITRVDTEVKLWAMVDELEAESEIGLDIETYPRDETARSLDPRRGAIGVISLGCTRGTRAFVIDVKSLPLPVVREALKRSLKGKPLITHNGAGFDMPFLRAFLGYEHDGLVYDTMVLDGLVFYAKGPLSESKDGNWKAFLKKDKDKAYTIGLAEVVEKRLGYTIDKEEQDADWGGIVTPAMVEYTAKDAAVLLPLKEKLFAALEELGMTAVADLEARFTPSMTWCATNGFKLDIEGWKEHARRAKEKLQEARARCDELAGDPHEEIGRWGWNASNHRKVGQALEALGAKVHKREETGNYITDEAALTAIKSPKKAKELARAILEHRSIEKYVTTWGENWFKEPKVSQRSGKIPSGKPDHLMVVDGRVYSKYNQLVVTGRGSSKHPNLQNLPADLRGYFVAPPNRMLLVGDYDQVEYVAAAHIAGDEQLLSPLREALGRGEKFDFHAITARMILESIHDREVTDEEVAAFRSRAKTVNFAVLYGASYKSLAKRLSVTPKTALGYIDALFANAPKLKEWSSQQRAKAKRGENVARTVLGRVRLADLKRRGGEWGANASQMLNHPVQGSCAEGYKTAAAMLYERREEFAGNPLLVNMVHDEFVLEVDDGANEDVELMNSIMIEGMLEALGPSAPISAGVKSVYRWKK